MAGGVCGAVVTGTDVAACAAEAVRGNFFHVIYSKQRRQFCAIPFAVHQNGVADVSGLISGVQELFVTLFVRSQPFNGPHRKTV